MKASFSIRALQIRRLLLIGFWLLTINCLQAQDTSKNSVSLGYGILTTEGFSAAGRALFNTVVTSVITFTPQSAEISGTGALFLEYKHRIGKHWCMVVSPCYTETEIDYFDQSASEPYIIEKNFYTTALAGMDYYWQNSPSLQLYSGLQLGGSYRTTKVSASDRNLLSTENVGNLAFQLTPVGLRTGKRHLGFFAEVGFGYKGILNCGMNYRF